MVDGPFGIEIPDDIGETAPESAPPAQENLESKGDESPQTPAQLADLDKLERFLYEGKEWTPKDLKNAILMREDYTRKTQELSKTREQVESESRYAKNLHVDLDKVLQNPALLHEFKKVYPKQYHAVAERILEKYSGSETSGKEVTNNAPLPRDVIDRLMKIDEISDKLTASESKAREAEIQTIQQQIDGYFDKLSKKYELADPDVVNSRAIALLERAKQDGSEVKINEVLLDKLFKEHQAQVEAKYSGYYESKIKSQKAANSQARDTGRGGDAPTSPPEKMNMKKAREKLFAEFEA